MTTRMEWNFFEKSDVGMGSEVFFLRLRYYILSLPVELEKTPVQTCLSGK